MCSVFPLQIPECHLKYNLLGRKVGSTWNPAAGTAGKAGSHKSRSDKTELAAREKHAAFLAGGSPCSLI